MLIRYQIIEDENLLIQKFSGKWDIDCYEAYIDMSLEELNLEPVKKIMTDLREIDISFLVKDIKRLIQLRQKIAIKDFVNVYIVDDPASTVMAHLYQDALRKEGYNYHYCSTVFQAVRLLGLVYTDFQTEEILRNLRHEF